MDYIYKEQSVNLVIRIFKGASRVIEDFSRARLVAFLLKDEARLRIPISINIREDGSIISTCNLPPGVYGLKIIWTKNKGRWQSVFESYHSFAITEYQHEATHPYAERVFVYIQGSVATYGYDGLDAYELSVLRGKTSLSEEEWLNKLNNIGSGSGSGSGSSGKPTTIEGNWELTFTVAKNNADGAGEAISYNAASTRTDRIVYPDGTITTVEKVGEVAITADIEGVTSKDGYIAIPANMGTSSRDIHVTATGEGGQKITRTITQAVKARFEVASIEDGNQVSFDSNTNEITCHDEDFKIRLTKIGDVGSITAAASEADWFEVAVNSDYIEVAINSNNESSEYRVGSITITSENGNTIILSLNQTYIAKTVYGNPDVILSYAQVSAAGGTARPVLTVKQKTTDIRNDGSEFSVTNVVTNDITECVYTDTEGLVETDGTVVCAANTEYSAKTVTAVTAKVTVNDKTNSGTAAVKQAAAERPKEYMYYGTMSLASFDEITLDKVNAAVTAGTLTKTDVAKRGKTEVSSQEGKSVVVLIPKSSSYEAKKDNGFGGKVLFSTDVIGANGSYVIDGSYKVYGEIYLSTGKKYIYIE